MLYVTCHKGQISEAELHSLRLRLDAGRISKAKRGELIHHLPTGLERDGDGKVHFDPDTSVQARLRLVFRKFQDLGSAQKVLRYLVKQGLKLPRRHRAGLYAGELLWKDASISAVHIRSQKHSTGLISNVDFQAWEEYLGDPPVIMASLDRLVHGAVVLKLHGKSYRAHQANQPPTE